MKKPDEIKKALECCFNAAQCGDCPYYPVSCDRELVRDAREYIRQLEAERDALLKEMRVCIFCDRDIPEACPIVCEHCRLDCPCKDCVDNNKWQRRGVQKED